MGVLRKYLVENFGLTATRAVLTQFGFAHGFRLAEAMHAAFTWESVGEWLAAATRILSLQGLFKVQPGGESPLSERGLSLLASYEAEQQLLHFGRSDAPACWTICGLLSGYLSRAAGQEIYVLEDRCLGQGHAACHLLGRTREQWDGDGRAPELAFFETAQLRDCLDVSLQRVVDTLKRTEQKLRARHRALVAVAREVDEPYGLVARSLPMSQLLELTRRVAKVDATVLITGESGTGKERIARLLHAESTRANGPFIAINCGAVAESLLESELFGHARGAFTGATADRPGLFEAAHGGSLLLDEVGELSAGMQVKLLRVLQEREIRRVGENRTRSVDVRVIAATHRDLAQRVSSQELRQDLYYRLKVVELRVPALRERREDVLPLARMFLADAARRMKRSITGLSPRAADQLLHYPWPGNVRELENAMERACALTRGARVDIEDLPEEVREALPYPTPGARVRPLEDVEKEYILAVLERNGNNQTRTAKQLRIGSATLYRKLKRYGVIERAKAPRSRSAPRRGHD
jgi:DNA-binding NtrC family response regulator